MKKFFTLVTASCTFVLVASAQFSENFDNDITSLSGNCWQFSNDVSWSNTSPIINGGTVNGQTSGQITTPYLNIVSPITVSFKYKLSGNLNGAAVRSIEVGLVDMYGAYTSLQTISMNSSTPTTVQNFSNTFTLSSSCIRMLRLTINGSGGSIKVLIDEINTSSSAKYGPVNHCNSAPIPAKDTFFFATGMTGYGNALTNDVEPDGETMTAQVLTPSPDGTIVMNADGSFSFTPNPGFTGASAFFVYQVCDNGFPSSICAAGQVKIYFVDPAPLAIMLTKFQGNKNGDKISLQWTIGANESVDRFEVERSTDGRQFTTAALVFTSEKTGTESYSYKETFSSDVVYYRLKMYEKSQSAEYSKILVFRSQSSGNPMRIVSNPVKDKLTVSFNSSSTQPVDMKVYDMNGRTLLSQKLTAYEGSNLVSMPLSSNFKTGFYVVEINDGTASQTAKFIKQ